MVVDSSVKLQAHGGVVINDKCNLDIHERYYPDSFPTLSDAADHLRRGILSVFILANPT